MPDLVVSEVAALKIAEAIVLQTQAQAVASKAEILALEQLLGPLAKTTSKGGIVSQVANVVISLDDIRNKIQAQADSAKAMEVAIGNLAKSIDTQTKALANIQHTQVQRLQTAQIVAVDTIKANMHQQAVVADSRLEQGKEPIKITPEQKKAANEENLQAQYDLRASIAISGTIESWITDGIVEGKKMALGWYADSTIDKFITDNWGKIKGAVAGIFAEEKVKEATTTVQAKAEQLLNDPTKKTG